MVRRVKIVNVNDKSAAIVMPSRHRQHVLDTLVESAAHLCEADRALIYRTKGEFLNPAAAYNVTSELREFVRQNPIRPGRHSCVARTARLLQRSRGPLCRHAS